MSPALKPKLRESVFERDGNRCLHCGTAGNLTPQHRKNRGMGGSRLLDVPSNLITLCATYNGLIESDADAAQEAISHGWKLRTWQDPTAIPVYDSQMDSWYYLDDDYSRMWVR